MSVVFPSEEWAKELVERINDDPEYAKIASGWEGSLAMHIQAEKGVFNDDFVLWMDPFQGQIRAFKKMDAIDEDGADFIISAKYSTWKKVVSGKLNPTMAMMTGKFKIKGEMKKLLKQIKASDAVMDHLKNMDVSFAG